MMTLTDLVSWANEFPEIARLVAEQLTGATFSAASEPEVIHVVREPTQKELVAAYVLQEAERKQAGLGEAMQAVREAGYRRTTQSS